MACITVIAEELEVSYEVDVTKDMLVRDLITELEALMGLPIGVNVNYQSNRSLVIFMLLI